MSELETGVRSELEEIGDRFEKIENSEAGDRI